MTYISANLPRPADVAENFYDVRALAIVGGQVSVASSSFDQVLTGGIAAIERRLGSQLELEPVADEMSVLPDLSSNLDEERSDTFFLEADRSVQTVSAAALNIANKWSTSLVDMLNINDDETVRTIVESAKPHLAHARAKWSKAAVAAENVPTGISSSRLPATGSGTVTTHKYI